MWLSLFWHLKRPFKDMNNESTYCKKWKYNLDNVYKSLDLIFLFLKKRNYTFFIFWKLPSNMNHQNVLFLMFFKNPLVNGVTVTVLWVRTWMCPTGWRVFIVWETLFSQWDWIGKKGCFRFAGPHYWIGPVKPGLIFYISKGLFLLHHKCNIVKR